MARRRAKEQARRHTPERVEGRKHIPVQTELYLEELSDRVEEVDVDVQTDLFLDRPPSPLFIPAKTGVDVATQIQPGDVIIYKIALHVVFARMNEKKLTKKNLQKIFSYSISTSK